MEERNDDDDDDDEEEEETSIVNCSAYVEIRPAALRAL